MRAWDSPSLLLLPWSVGAEEAPDSPAMPAGRAKLPDFENVDAGPDVWRRGPASLFSVLVGSISGRGQPLGHSAAGSSLIPGSRSPANSIEGRGGSQASCFFRPTSVRILSASKAASNGFRNVSLNRVRSNPLALSSSFSKPMSTVSAYSEFLRRFWAIIKASLRPIAKSMTTQSDGGTRLECRPRIRSPLTRS